MVSFAYLSGDREYPQGEVSEEGVERLVALVDNPFGLRCGHHPCDLDPSGSGSPARLEYRGQSIPTQCSSHILVPGVNLVYVAPALIFDYIRAHKHQPPAGLVDGVLRCPRPGSPEHVAAIKLTAPNPMFLI